MNNMRIVGKRLGAAILLTQSAGSVLMQLCGHGLQVVEKLLKQLKSHPLLWRRHKLACWEKMNSVQYAWIVGF